MQIKWFLKFLIIIPLALASNFYQNPKIGVFSLSSEGTQSILPEFAKNMPIIDFGAIAGHWDDEEVLQSIAFCESGGRHWGDDGEVLKGKQVPSDRGILQINALIHNGRALALGFDIMTLEGNLGYGRYLLRTEGLRPWRNSLPCLEKNFGIK